MTGFISKYGVYTVPIGSTLFRTADTTGIFETMFFAFCPYGTGSSSIIRQEIQIWQTTSEIHALFMLKGKNAGGHPKSAVLDIYNFCFPNKPTKRNYVDIKKGNAAERLDLLKALQVFRISSWVCSVENSWQMELFIFDHKIIYESVKFTGYMNKDDEAMWEIDSFDRTSLNRLPVIDEEHDSLLDILLGIR